MSNPGVKIIRVGKGRVGLSGLEDAFKEVRNQAPGSDEKTAEMLLKRIRKENYITSVSEEQYKKALLREYRKYFGEPVEEETFEGLNIRILGPGCPNCERLEKTVQEALLELNMDAELDHVRDPQEIAEAGVFGTPALLINGKVISVGRMPAKGKIKTWINEAVSSM